MREYQVQMYPGKAGSGEGHARWAVYNPNTCTWEFADKPGKKGAERLCRLRNIQLRSK